MDKLISQDSLDVIRTLGNLNERFAGKKVLITGAAGFLGVQFVHYFCKLNDEKALSTPVQVLALDSFIRGKPNWIMHSEKRPDIKFEKIDITKPFQIPKDVGFIIHAASIASPIFYRQFPIETMDANVIGLRNLLDFATHSMLESFLFFSSSEIYGDPDPSIPTTETYRGLVSCTGPRACYDESKRYGETLCVNFFKTHQAPVKIARPFNNYGPGLKISDRRVIPDLFRDVLSDRNLVLLSDGRATRTFCYVSDALNGYLRLLLCNENGEAYNIGTDKPEISMRDLANLVVQISGKPLQVQFQKSGDSDYLTDNPQRRCPNIEKARTILGYEPLVALEEGLARCFRYYLSHRDE